jgi:hypothetical protein
MEKLRNIRGVVIIGAFQVKWADLWIMPPRRWCPNPNRLNFHALAALVSHLAALVSQRCCFPSRHLGFILLRIAMTWQEPQTCVLIASSWMLHELVYIEQLMVGL